MHPYLYSEYSVLLKSRKSHQVSRIYTLFERCTKLFCMIFSSLDARWHHTMRYPGVIIVWCVICIHDAQASVDGWMHGCPTSRIICIRALHSANSWSVNYTYMSMLLSQFRLQGFLDRFCNSWWCPPPPPAQKFDLPLHKGGGGGGLKEKKLIALLKMTGHDDKVSANRYLRGPQCVRALFNKSHALNFLR